jgi:hypothetical protein
LSDCQIVHSRHKTRQKALVLLLSDIKIAVFFFHWYLMIIHCLNMSWALSDTTQTCHEHYLTQHKQVLAPLGLNRIFITDYSWYWYWEIRVSKKRHGIALASQFSWLHKHKQFFHEMTSSSMKILYLNHLWTNTNYKYDTIHKMITRTVTYTHVWWLVRSSHCCQGQACLQVWWLDDQNRL